MTTPSVSLQHLTELLGDWRSAAHSDYSALAERIRLLTIDGRIRAGMRLPSERQLADRLGISRTTVNSALDELRRSGYALSRQGSGTVVQIPGRTGDVPIPAAGDLLDLSRATSAAAPGVHSAAERAMERLPARLSTDGYELSGLPSLREAIAADYTVKGVPTTPEQVLVTNGGAGAIALIARTLISIGDRVVVETPGYPHSNEAFRAMGARLVPTIVDGDDGWDAADFAETVARALPTLAYLMPDFHNPTSRSMPVGDRERIVAAAAGRGTVIVCDETTAALDIDRGWEAPPLAAFDSSGGTVISVGSASKTVWGGLRVGWVRASEPLVARLHAARFSFDLGVGVLDQLVFSELFEKLPAVVAYRRGVHRASRDTLAESLAQHLPDARLHRVDGGVASWVDLAQPVSSALTIAARAQGLLIGAGPWFGLHGEFERHLRVPITATPDQVRRGVEILGLAMHELPERAPVAPRHIL